MIKVFFCSESSRKTSDKSPPKTRSQAAREASSKLPCFPDSLSAVTSKKIDKVDLVKKNDTIESSKALVVALTEEKLTPQIYFNDQTTENWLNTFKVKHILNF